MLTDEPFVAVTPLMLLEVKGSVRYGDRLQYTVIAAGSQPIGAGIAVDSELEMDTLATAPPDGLINTPRPLLSTTEDSLITIPTVPLLGATLTLASPLCAITKCLNYAVLHGNLTSTGDQDSIEARV